MSAPSDVDSIIVPGAWVINLDDPAVETLHISLFLNDQSDIASQAGSFRIPSIDFRDLR